MISFREPSGRPKTQDEVFAGIALQVPGYAGTYYDAEGSPVTNLVDLGRSFDAEQAIGPLVRDGADGRGPRKSKFRKVTYDFLQLKSWKDFATRTVLALPNVVFVDIDEVNNRLSIGVQNESALRAVEAIMRDNKIPGLVAVMLLPPPDPPPPSNIQAGPQTLRDTFPNPIGGIMLSTGAHLCTLGFNALLSSDLWVYSSDHFFVTPAHCMNSVGSPTSTPFYQPGNYNLIGYEYRQPLWRSYSPQGQTDCPNDGWSQCAYADAALVRYQGYINWGAGAIARTTFAGTYADTGSITLDPYASTWSIADSVNDYTLFMGQQLHKVGFRSGWTQGDVLQTCANYRLFLNGVATPYVILCSWSAGFTSLPGDSGSPVFMYKFGSYPRVSLVGMVWAGQSGQSTFSFYPYIAYELTDRDRPQACSGIFNCWPRLTVSMQY